MDGRSWQARSPPRSGDVSAVETVFGLYVIAMQTTLTLAIPVVAAIAATGVVVSLLQSAIGVQDQNISFGPKIGVVAVLLAAAGVPALLMLVRLLTLALATLPRLSG
jgi:flagellar biosynthesis protein FliQ